MNDSVELLKRFRMPPGGAGQTDGAGAPELDDEVACPAFGYLRGVRERAIAVEFRRAREGDSVSFPYAWLGPTRYHPSTGVSLLFVGSELYLVVLRGRNLNKLTESGISLYERGLLRSRVTWVQEMKRVESEALAGDDCVVENIQVKTVDAQSAARVLGMAQDGQ